MRWLGSNPNRNFQSLILSLISMIYIVGHCKSVEYTHNKSIYLGAFSCFRNRCIPKTINHSRYTAMSNKVKHLTPRERAIVATLYKSEDKPTQEELARQFHCAPITIRRALAEEGVLQLKGYMTENQQQVFDFLTAQGLSDIEKLKEFVVQARMGNGAK